MCNQHNGNALLAIQLLENRHDLSAGLGVEVARGLIRKDKLRIVDQRTADCDALLLPAGKLGGLIRGKFPQAGLVQ